MQNAGHAVLAAIAALALTNFVPARAHSEGEMIARGKYLVMVAGCTDCHTPGHFLGKPDLQRYLGGSDVGMEIPQLGVFYAPNLTPDRETGLGTWSIAQIVAALQTGVRPDGRQLSPAMPWRAYANITSDDVTAIAAYLQSLPAVSNKVPGPFGPTEKPTAYVMKIIAPER